MSDERMYAISREPLTKAVVRGLPFQFTVDPETNPVPFTVTVKVIPGGPRCNGVGNQGLVEEGHRVLRHDDQRREEQQSDNAENAAWENELAGREMTSFTAKNAGT